MNKLAELRRSKKLSQREVASALNISQSTLSQYERGGRGIDDVMLKKLCSYYNISADELLGFPILNIPKQILSANEDAHELFKLFEQMNNKGKIRLLGAAYAILAEQSVSSKADLEKLRKSIK